jgi:cytosine/adenosine deaminase-related metal-dependent hydrolase
MEGAELVISDVSIVSMDSRRPVLHEAWIAVTGREITALGTGSPPPGHRVIDGRGGVVMPGMVSAHQHVIDSLLRGGIEQERTLLDWLLNVYYAGTSAYTPADCQVATQLTLSEATYAGITTIVDNWGVNNGDDPVRVDECAKATLEVHQASGLRVVFARMFADRFPEEWTGLVTTFMRKLPGKTLALETLSEPLDAALAHVEDLFARYHGSADGRVRIAPSPIMAHLVSPEGFVEAQRLAEAHDSIVPFHHCETEFNSRMFRASGPGMGVTDYLSAHGLLSSRSLAAHCVWLSDRDIRLMALAGVSAVHCPSCNMFLGSGIAPVARLQQAGVTVGLGTDDVNTSSNVSMLAEMRQAAYLARVADRDPGALTAERALEMATIDGARALGLDEQIGSLVPGKRADLVLLDRGGPHWFPCHDLASAIVFQAHSSDVRTVLVDGRVVLDERRPAFAAIADPPRLHARAQRAAEAVIERAGMTGLINRGWRQLSAT